jgi:hypothetical protein
MTERGALVGLFALRTRAVLEAQELERSKDPTAPLAWANLSNIEEGVAGLFQNSNPRGRIARRSAVYSAVKAGDIVRANNLVGLYVGEPGTESDLQCELYALLPTNS